MMTNAALLAITLIIFYTVDVKRLVASMHANYIVLHLFFATTIALTVLGVYRAGVDETMPQHFLGLCAATLILGLNNVIISCIIVGLILLVTGQVAFIDWGAVLLLSMILPCCLVAQWQKQCAQLNLWAFTFKVAAVGALLTLLTKTALMASYYYVYHDKSINEIIDSYLSISTLFWFPEILLNVTIILTLLQHRPHWIATYNAPTKGT